MSGIINKIEETLHIGGHKKEEHKGEQHGEHKGEHHGDHKDHGDHHKGEHQGEHKEGFVDKIKDKIHGDHDKAWP
ncbi:hypothetical protein VNO77_34103 [Canavalia gladiata]|uniref:Uncharacterized protein n=1 Tax=Canavalia gladiata TaxID=3824 RepID=A0AAN9KFM6_CANGL